MAAFNIPYTGVGQPYPGGNQTIPQITQAIPQPQVSNSFAWVQGEASAKAYPVAPGNTILLMDSEAPILYMKSTDMSGRPLPMETRYLVSKEEYDKLQNGSESQTSMENYVTKEELNKYIDEAEKKFVIRKRGGADNGKSSV